MKNKVSIYLSIFFFILILGTGCSTKKPTFINKTYHNITTHYNVWWNGNESLKEAVKTLRKQNKDDYTQVLSVYQLGSREEAVAQNSTLDRAIEKANKGIKKHSINVKGKEYVVWVQNCYLLLAKAQYYKYDYGLAALTFRYITSQFKDSEQAYEAMIWYARSMTADGQYSLAESTLDQLKSLIDGKKAPDKLRKDLFLAYADCAIMQRKYHYATQYLNISIEENKNRSLDTRLYFIMGQIYQITNKKNTAIKYYEKVLKRGTPYEMEFNTRLNIAACYNLRRGDSKDIIKSLEKMLKDKKNTEYKDQIYYALGEVSMISKNATKACEYWKMSVEESQGNIPQKIKSSLTLADAYYDLFEDYVSAQMYYDTALNHMPKNYPNYDQIKAKQIVLTSLVANILTVQNLDSLLVFSEMLPSERDKVMDRKIAELKQKEQIKLEKEMEQMYAAQTSTGQNNLKGNWYFYNVSTVQRGKENFVKTWGRRLLEDNWRLSEKRSSFMAEEVASESSKKETEEGNEAAGKTEASKKSTAQAAIDSNKAKDPHNKEFYLSKVLTTQAQKDSANNEIANAFLSMGFIYNDGIKNERKAIEALLALIERYPEYEEVLPAYYQLYRIYDRKGDTPNANYYKNMILRGFPDSDYANLIRDENYYQEMVRRENLAQTEYLQTYSAYQKKRYNEVLTLSKSAKEAFRDPELLPKFSYLEALATGKLQGKRILITKLEEIVANYPQTEILPLIKKQIELLKSGKLPFATALEEQAEAGTASNESVDVAAETPDETVVVQTPEKTPDQLLEEASLVYRYRANIGHYFILLINTKNLDVNDLKYAVSDFNKENFMTLALKISNFLFTENEEILMVQQFETAQKAMDYYTLIQKNKNITDKLPKGSKLFVISLQNYATFYNQKNVPAYEYFFEKNYKN